MNEEASGLAHEIEHLMRSIRLTDPKKFVELCDLLGVDPEDFDKFLKEDVARQDN